MFGYMIADRSRLSEEQQKRYKECYCGLCRTLKYKYGSLSRMMLTYDLTYLALFLNALYEPEEKTGCEDCFVHPIKAADWWSSKYTEYAADMTVILGYLKMQDDWNDDRNRLSKLQMSIFRKKYKEVCDVYPNKTDRISSYLNELSQVEKNEIMIPDIPINLFGKLMGEVFVYQDDRWSETIIQMGEALGRFVYTMDAVMDLDKDIQTGNYNPFKNSAESSDDRYKNIMEMQLGDAVFYYDKLPIVKDDGIIRNILFSGAWTAYRKRFEQIEKGTEADGSGSL